MPEKDAHQPQHGRVQRSDGILALPCLNLSFLTVLNCTREYVRLRKLLVFVHLIKVLGVHRPLAVIRKTRFPKSSLKSYSF